MPSTTLLGLLVKYMKKNKYSVREERMKKGTRKSEREKAMKRVK